MIKANYKAHFGCDISTVWEVVTNNNNYTWRSDISKIVILDDGLQFIEYAKNGFPTTFTITKKEPYNRYEFDIVNKNMKGHWTGIFTKVSDGTEIDFTEELDINNPIMKLLAGMYLKKQQKNYINDLRKRLG